MRRLAPVIALIAVMVFAGTAVARGRLLTFGTGDVTITGRSSATLDNGAGEYSGVYLRSRSLSAKRLRAVHISFRYTGDTAGGAPRFSIPLNTHHAESVTPYAFLDANNCGDTGLVSTDASNCKVFLNFSSESFDNWHDLVTTHPTWRLPRRAIPFIIADQPGHYVISHIDLR
jgi:hypothetical protein